MPISPIQTAYGHDQPLGGGGCVGTHAEGAVAGRPGLREHPTIHHREREARRQVLRVSLDIWLSVAAAAMIALVVAFAGFTLSNMVAAAELEESVRIRVSEADADLSVVCALSPNGTRCRDTDLFADAP